MALDHGDMSQEILRLFEIAVHKEAVHVGLQVLGAHKPWLKLIKTEAFTQSRTRKANHFTSHPEFWGEVSVAPSCSSSSLVTNWKSYAWIAWMRLSQIFMLCQPVMGSWLPRFLWWMRVLRNVIVACRCVFLCACACQSIWCLMVRSYLFRTMDAARVMMLPCFHFAMVVLLLLLLRVYCWSVQDIKIIWNLFES